MSGLNYGRKYTMNGSRKINKPYPPDKEGIFELPDGKYILRMERKLKQTGDQTKMCSILKSADKQYLEKMHKELQEKKDK